MSDGVNVDAGHWRELDQPRVPPLTIEEMNVAVRGIAKAERPRPAVGG